MWSRVRRVACLYDNCDVDPETFCELGRIYSVKRPASGSYMREVDQNGILGPRTLYIQQVYELTDDVLDHSISEGTVL